MSSSDFRKKVSLEKYNDPYKKLLVSVGLVLFTISINPKAHAITRIAEAREQFYEEEIPEDTSNNMNFKDRLEFQSTEILMGKVLSVDNIINERYPTDRFFELEVEAVVKSASGINIGHSINVRYKHEPTIISGFTKINLSEGDLVRVYANRKVGVGDYIDLRYAGDSIEVLDKKGPGALRKFIEDVSVKINEKVPLTETQFKAIAIGLAGILAIYLIFKWFGGPRY